MRFRRLILALGTALLIGAAYIATRNGGAVPDVSLPSYLFMMCVVAASAAMAAAAVHRSERTRSEFLRFSRTMEDAVGTISTRQAQDATALADIRQNLARLEPLSAVRQPSPSAAPQETMPLQPELPRVGPGVQRHGATPGGAVADALRAVIEGGGMALALEPVLSIADGTTAGFEAYARVTLADGRASDIRRLAGRASGVDPVDFERTLLTTAIAAARRRSPAEADAPLHVALSGALLANEAHMRAVAALTGSWPNLPAMLVPSVPAALFADAGAARAGLAALQAAGFGFAAEVDESAPGAMAIRFPPSVRFLKLPAHLLTDSRAMPDVLHADWARTHPELRLIATDVADAAEAVMLAELGVELMAGVDASDNAPA